MNKDVLSLAGAVFTAGIVSTAVASQSVADVKNLKPGDGINGFLVTSLTDLPEVKGRLVRMVYAKNGAELAWLDREDDNMTFSIGFRTLPDDDTGVAHIIEHSVLCGSEKYPVKEPFVELLKSSFATFLNAFTSTDATMYPVCSRNSKDFLNLIDVYMDAVLHPLSVKSPLAFRQEGWHYEIDGATGELKRNGVVYNEMKGAFADPERRLYHELNRLLYPNTSYGYVSGGDPSAIPDLTFEKYKDFYEKHYHPSNARIFLDGSVNLHEVLKKLDGFLCAYDRREIDAPVRFQWPVTAGRKIDYEIGSGETAEGKVFVATAWVCGRFDEREKYIALGVLADALAGDNEAPLKKALLDAGFCEDVSMRVFSHVQIQANLVAKGVKEENVDRVRALVRNTISAIADVGLDHSRISALLDRAEFRDREKDYGGFPRGLAFYMDAADIWHYGGDPADAFRNGSIFKSLRAKIKDRYFEKLLSETFRKNSHRADVEMYPSPGLAKKNLEEEKKALKKIKNGWKAEDVKKVLDEYAELEKFQSRQDSPEDIAKLPVLAVKDIPEKGRFTKSETVESGGVAIIRPHTQANGVMHAVCHFDVRDLTVEELADLPMLACVLGELPTVKYGIGELRNAIDGRLGRLSARPAVYADAKKGNAARPAFAVSVSALESRTEDALSLLPEILLETQYTDVKNIGNLLRQASISIERSANGLGGRNFAFRRAGAQMSSRGAIEDIFFGIAQIRHLQAVDGTFGKEGAAYAKKLAALASKIFTRDRLTVCLSDNISVDWAKRFAEAFPSAPVGDAVCVPPFKRCNEGYITPGRVCNVARLAYPADSAYNGSAVVAARILSLDYLWEEIRVKGGAYGGSFRVRPNGDTGWLSWNDPKPARTIDVYAGSGKALAGFAEGKESLDRFIVSAVASTEPYLTASLETSNAADLWMSGRTSADQQRIRSQILRTTKKDLKEFSKRFDGFVKDSAICIVGGQPAIDSCKKILEKVETVAK